MRLAQPSISFFVLFSACVTLAFCQVYVGPLYQSQLATKKLSLLNQAISNDTNPGKFPGVGLLKIFVENMDTSFDTQADDMPKEGGLFGGRRKKLIHSVGCIAPAKWVPINNTRYTGVFKGCSNLLIRFSLAKTPANGPRGYAPGISVKCFRNGVPSGNLFAMYSLEGQDSWNFFKHDLTNHVPDLSSNADFALQKLRGKFAEASDWPTMLGLSDFAKYDENGRNSSATKSPFRLVFHPTTAVRNSFGDSPSSIDFEYVIAKGLKPGTIYTVYAQDQPFHTPNQYTVIGRIDLTGVPTTSGFSDQFLFFQHTRMEDDFALNPSWVPYAQQIIKNQQSVDHYTFPDLPFN